MSDCKCSSSGEAINKAVDASIEGIQKLTAAIEKIAPDAWNTMVKQHIIEGWCDLSICILWAVITAIYIVLCKKIWCNHDKWFEDWDAGKLVFIVLVSIVLLLVDVIVFASFGTDGINSILNPEYYAGIEILDRIR